MVTKGAAQLRDVIRTQNVRDPVCALIARNCQEEDAAAHVESAGGKTQVYDLGQTTIAQRYIPGSDDQRKVTEDRVQTFVSEGVKRFRILVADDTLGSNVVKRSEEFHPKVVGIRHPSYRTHDAEAHE
jgi:hypothetical protein